MTSKVNAVKLLNDLKAQLKNEGFRTPGEDYFLIHAPLALLSPGHTRSGHCAGLAPLPTGGEGGRELGITAMTGAD